MTQAVNVIYLLHIQKFRHVRVEVFLCHHRKNLLALKMFEKRAQIKIEAPFKWLIDCQSDTTCSLRLPDGK